MSDYAPVFIGKGVLDVDETANRMALWSQEFFGDPALESEGHYHIQGSVPDFHIDIYKDLMSNKRLYYVTAPSEFAKTTVCTLIYPLYQIIYFKEPFTVLCSRVGSTTEGLLDLMKDEIDDNRKLIEVYGNLRTTKGKWNVDEIELSNGSVVLSVPVLGNLRSRRSGQFRITLFIMDDPEELHDLDSPVQMHRNKKWLSRTAIPRLDRRFGKARVIGTYIGRGCTIEYVMNHTMWSGRKYTALVNDGNGNVKSIWEDKWPTNWLLNEKKEHIKNNELSNWMFERMNEPMEDSQKNLRGYEFHALIYQRKADQNVLITGQHQDEPIPVNIYCAADPAYSMNSSADQRAIIVYALGQKLVRNEHIGEPFMMNCIWILEYIYNFMSPDLIIDAIFKFHKKYYLSGAILETIGAAQLYESIMTKRLQSDSFFFENPFNPVFVKSQPKNKLKRVYEGLQPKVKLGQFFLRNGHTDLMEEMEMLRDDKMHLLDALEMGLRMSTSNNEPIRRVSRKTEQLAKFSRRHLEVQQRMKGKFNHGSNVNAIPHSLNQIMGRR